MPAIYPTRTRCISESWIWKRENERNKGNYPGNCSFLIHVEVEEADMGLNVASVKSYVSSALTTTLFGSGVGEREVGKLTSIIMNKMLFAQGWQFSCRS
ncbi:hypothetical protein AB3H41_01885 [Escherichia coli]